MCKTMNFLMYFCPFFKKLWLITGQCTRYLRDFNTKSVNTLSMSTYNFHIISHADRSNIHRKICQKQHLIIFRTVSGKIHFCAYMLLNPIKVCESAVCSYRAGTHTRSIISFVLSIQPTVRIPPNTKRGDN